ncbi:LysR family transcriptional regulator [Amycolatopsis sp. FDAARGOS 1241]|uniref:LysR family transcriptional regulator n=1 Tax=Amycolatopsis sp. FDAARGOS 1241 TaxID=2778070 RepID=UPI001950AD4A|nr:LysR family transcriptional regulator [Amycolatopsis sp. FDAARGOS 1241]QRP47819.1 LysR family transcriptional regulator [Amycolatopsis sp. FDAARGOS 1241]QRP48511.1 LysR family transcriptional regulator [Amycolatopsis sp. FDAARGOS 1241]
MELRHLRYFVAVAEECHFGRAADRLHIAQPALSHQVKQLETELGVELLARTTRKVQLTPAGRRYLDRARAVLASVDAAGVEAGRIAQGEVGRVAIGFTGSATYELLPSLARVLRRDFPGIDLALKGEMLTPGQVSALVEGGLDIGFLRPPVREPGLVVRVLRREPLIAALPASHPLTARDTVRLAELREEPFICYPSRHRSVVYDAVFDACQQAGFVPSVVQEVGETATLVSFVAGGLGVALVPASVRHLQITGCQYRPLAGTTREVQLAVAVRTGEDSPHVARVLSRTHTLLGGPR